MAAEYSRNLSRRIFAGQLRIAGLGYWTGSSAPYGYQRWAVDPATGQELLLPPGVQKAAAVWRTILRPGPERDVRMVQRMFRLLVDHGRTCGQIARTLNAEGWPTKSGRPWTDQNLRPVLRNERYVGVTTYAATARNLMPEARAAKPVRQVGAIDAIIAPEVFARAQAILDARRPPPGVWSDEAMLQGLAALSNKHGKLTHDLMRTDKSLPSREAYIARFGSMARAMALIELPRDPRFLWTEHVRDLRARPVDIVGRLRLALASLDVITALRGDHVLAGARGTAAVFLTSQGNTLWRGRQHTDWILGVRLARGYGLVLDYYVFPWPVSRGASLRLSLNSAAGRTGMVVSSIDAAAAALLSAIG